MYEEMTVAKFNSMVKSWKVEKLRATIFESLNHNIYVTTSRSPSRYTARFYKKWITEEWTCDTKKDCLLYILNYMFIEWYLSDYKVSEYSDYL